MRKLIQITVNTFATPRGPLASVFGLADDGSVHEYRGRAQEKEGDPAGEWIPLVPITQIPAVREDQPGSLIP